MKKLQIVLQILFLSLAVFFGWKLYLSVLQPIKFQDTKDERYELVVERLKEIRKVQIAYKDKNGQFAPSWDSLMIFVDNDSLPQIRKIGALTDSLLEEGWTEEKALKEKLVIGGELFIRDTVYVGVKEEYLSSDYNTADMKYIPGIEDKVEFFLGRDILTTASGVDIPVFEARAHNNQIFELKRNGSEFVSLGIGDEFYQSVVNLNEEVRLNEKYPGLKVGSLTEPNNSAGNWEN